MRKILNKEIKIIKKIKKIKIKEKKKYQILKRKK